MRRLARCWGRTSPRSEMVLARRGAESETRRRWALHRRQHCASGAEQALDRRSETCSRPRGRFDDRRRRWLARSGAEHEEEPTLEPRSATTADRRAFLQLESEKTGPSLRLSRSCGGSVREQSCKKRSSPSLARHSPRVDDEDRARVRRYSHRQGVSYTQEAHRSCSNPSDIRESERRPRLVDDPDGELLVSRDGILRASESSVSIRLHPVRE